MGKKWNSHILLTRIQNDTTTMEKKISQFPRKLNIHLSYNPEFLLLIMYTREMKTYIYTKTCMWICIAMLFLITKSRNNQKSFNKWMDEQRYIHIMECYPLTKREQTTDTLNMDGSQKHHARWKKLNTRGYILYDVIYMVFQQRQNCKDRTPASGSQGLGGKRGGWL